MSTPSFVVSDTLLPVQGVRLASVDAKIRYANRHDLSLIEICENASVSAQFTKNAFFAAPVKVAKEHLVQRNKNQKSYLLINAGNANAGTGEPGLKAAQQTCELLAKAFSVKPEQVLPFSTGVIGQLLPVEKFEKGIAELAVTTLSENAWHDVAKAIMTTDTREKSYSTTFEIEGKSVCVTGITKGSGMIKPNMATMLAYMATDADIEQALLDTIIREISDKSFNCISVDGDTSTNDAFVLIATGKSGVKIQQGTSAFELMYEALEKLAVHLAQSIVRDGEGATKFMEVSVQGGVDYAECKEVAYTIAHSPLVKTAFFASDPNWGRILAALGRAPLQNPALDISRVDIFLGETMLINQGELAQDYTEEKGQKEMKATDISIGIFLNRGEASAKVWTCDFSYDYVKINAKYRS